MASTEYDRPTDVPLSERMFKNLQEIDAQTAAARKELASIADSLLGTLNVISSGTDNMPTPVPAYPGFVGAHTMVCSSIQASLDELHETIVRLQGFIR